MKLVIFNNDFTPGTVIPDVISYSGDLDNLEYLSADPLLSKGSVSGFEGFYIAVDDDRDINSITKEELLTEMKIKKVAELSGQAETAILEGFYHNGDYFEFGYKDQDNFTQRLLIMTINPAITQIEWKTENNGVKVFTRDQFMGIIQGAEAHKTKNIDQYRAIKDDVEGPMYDTFEKIRSANFWTTIPGQEPVVAEPVTDPDPAMAITSLAPMPLSPELAGMDLRP